MTGDRLDPVRGNAVRRGIPFSGRLLFGAVAITLGVLWTADNLGLLDADAVLRWWPVILVLFGLMRLTGLFGPRHAVSGTLFTVAGSWMLLRELDVVQVSIFKLWPVFLIVLGGSLVWRSMRGEQVPDDGERDSYPKPVAIMGGVVRNIESQDLVGIEASAVMGGVELDLHGAKARGREVVVEAFAWWGGIELYVPEDWRVVNEVTPIMGGVEDKSRLAVADPVTTLIIRGVVVMAGIEVSNKRGRGADSGARSRVFVAGIGRDKSQDEPGPGASRGERSGD